MNLSIIIPNYNGEYALKSNLPYVEEALSFYIGKKKATGEIIIIDDSSTDNSLSVIRDFQDKIRNIKIKLIESKNNYGFSSSVNKGVGKADFEIVVLLNTDVRPQKDFLLPLVKHFSDNNVFGVGCMDKSIEPEGVMLRGRGVGRWKRGFLIHSLGNLDKDSTLWASGGSSAFRKSTWNKLGGLYEIYNPFYWEDIDLSYRALKAGYAVLFEKESVVTHNHEEGAIKLNYSYSDVKVTAYKNQVLFSWINISDKDLIFKHIIWLPLHALSALVRSDIDFLQGLFKALTNISHISKIRNNTQKLVVKKDIEIIKSIMK